jgi:NADH dehydrogenase
VLKADLVVWAAGIRHRWLRNLDGLEVNRANQLVVATTLATTRDPDIFALGDCAAARGRRRTRRRDPAAARAGRTAAGIAPREEHRGAPLRASRCRRSRSPISDRSCRWASVGGGHADGRLIGGSLLVQGLIARWMYVSLYKLHQVAIYGYLRVALDTVSRIVRHRLEPRVKLH